MIDLPLLASTLGTRFGHDLAAEPRDSSGVLLLRVEGLTPPNGFCVAIKSGWRSIDASFQPDPFASGLLKTICAEDELRRKEFASLVSAFASCGITCVIHISGQSADPSSLPAGQWSQFDLSCSRLTDKSDEQQDAEEVAGACLALVFALLPIDSDTTESSPLGHGLPEGSLTRISVNRYERSPANRAAAIAIHGARCLACGFDFNDVYGAIGAGFIEVHHVVPVSRMGPGYIVSPNTDLVPLCPNCHQMVHRRDPPFEVEELREFMKRKVRQENSE